MRARQSKPGGPIMMQIFRLDTLLRSRNAIPLIDLLQSSLSKCQRVKLKCVASKPRQSNAVHFDFYFLLPELLVD
jgi:hypothetical protein